MSNDGHVYQQLRAAALDATALGVPPIGPGQVVGLVVDLPAVRGTATFVTLADGTTSLYASAGGGTLGAGEHDDVRRTAAALLELVGAQLGAFSAGSRPELPAADVVRFHVLVAGAPRYADVPRDAFFGVQPHPLAEVVAATNAVLGSMAALV